MAQEIVSISEAGRRLSVNRQTIADISVSLGFHYKPVPGVPFGKGLDIREVELIRQRLAPIESTPVAVSA